MTPSTLSLKSSISGSAQETDFVGDCSVAQLGQAAQDHEEDRQMAGWKSLKMWKERNSSLKQGRVRKKVEQLGPIENDPEYQLIVEVIDTMLMVSVNII